MPVAFKTAVISVIMMSSPQGDSVSQMQYEVPTHEACVAIARKMVQGGNETQDATTAVFTIDRTIKGDWSGANVRRTVYCAPMILP